MRGEKKFLTSVGACVSFGMRLLVLVYGLIKLEHLLQLRNPTLNSNKEPLEEGEIFETSKQEFMIAFTVEHWFDGVKENPRYIQWTMAKAE